MAEQTEAVIALMRKTIADKDEQIKQLQQTIEQLQATIANLTETIEEFRRKFFGSSSEKTGRQETGEEKEAEKITVSSYTRERKPKSKREDIYKNLPVVEVRCPVPEDQRLCPDCDTPMKTVTYEFVREVLKITPAKVERVRYYQEVLACPVCREEDEGTFVKASVPTALLAHSLASPSIVAYVMYQKFMNAVPFYRQELDWLQMGAPLARETTSNWCIKCALAYFQPVYDMLHAYLLSVRSSMQMKLSVRFFMKRTKLQHQNHICGYIYPAMTAWRRSFCTNTSPGDRGSMRKIFWKVLPAYSNVTAIPVTTVWRT